MDAQQGFDYVRHRTPTQICRLPAPSRMSDIFLSYSREDQAIARRFATAFDDVDLIMAPPERRLSSE